MLIGGSVVNGLPPRARRIAMVFQSYALYPHKSVLDNIVFPLKAQRMDKAERARKARWAAELLDIEHLLGRRPRQLSGGERQRVALARALVRDTSRYRTSTPSCAPAPATSSRVSSSVSAPRRSTSRMTRSRPWGSGSGSPSCTRGGCVS